MPSHQDNLAAVRDACRAANRDADKWNVILWDEEPVTLPDVLLALGKFQENEERLVTITLSDEGKLAISVFGDDDIEFWNLRLPLSGQSEETVAYLATLLKRDD